MIDSNIKIDNLYLKNYAPQRGIRSLVITLIVVGTLTALALTGKFNSLSTWRLSSNLWKPITCAGVGLTLLTTTGLIFYKAKKGLAKGKIFGKNHWKKCAIEGSEHTGLAHLDLSGLDAQGNGRARLFFKHPKHAVSTGILGALWMPVYTATVIVYNVLRLLVIPFYILVQMRREKQMEKSHPRGLYPFEGRFTASDIPKQMLLSCKRIIQAPFYGIAMFFSMLSALIDPMNGIKLGSAIEFEWNDKVPMRDSGVWMMALAAFRDWKWEGGGGPKKLGQNGFFYAGSWLPHCDVIFNNHIFQWIADKVDSDYGSNCKFLSQEECEKKNIILDS